MVLSLSLFSIYYSYVFFTQRGDASTPSSAAAANGVSPSPRCKVCEAILSNLICNEEVMNGIGKCLYDVYIFLLRGDVVP